MIPKKIHYCWFGHGEKTALAKKCIQSWEKFCPDYEIVEWNEDNFDIRCCPFVENAYKNKKYAFVSDYARLAVVCREGGIYLDTDVELLRNPDALLDHKAFFGYETNAVIASGLGFGSEGNGEAVQAMLHAYDPYLDGTKAYGACPALNTQALVGLGLQADGKEADYPWGHTYPAEVFNPFSANTGRLTVTDRTISIHWYGQSWIPLPERLRSRITRPFHRWFGDDCFTWLKGKRRS